MGAGVHGGFGNTKGFNGTGENDIGDIDKIDVIDGKNKKMPIKSEPNSVTKKYSNGKLLTERYYDENGNPYLDIDYTNHGNPKTHPNVPHKHYIKIKNGHIDRLQEEKINDR